MEIFKKVSLITFLIASLMLSLPLISNVSIYGSDVRNYSGNFSYKELQLSVDHEVDYQMEVDEETREVHEWVYRITRFVLTSDNNRLIHNAVLQNGEKSYPFTTAKEDPNTFRLTISKWDKNKLPDSVVLYITISNKDESNKERLRLKLSLAIDYSTENMTIKQIK